MIKTLGRILPALVLSAIPAAAQYSPPGGLAEERVTAKEQVMSSYRDARWSLGPLRLEPSLAITEIGYVSNVFFSGEGESESDLKAGALAALRGYIHLGPKVLLSPFAGLRYSWWQQQEDLRSLNESFGVQAFGDFNRLQLELQAGRVERQRNLSSELEVPVDLRNDRIELAFEVDFWGPFSLFGSVAEEQSRQFGEAAESQVPGLDLAALAVDTERLNGGIGYEFGSGLKISLGLEQTEATYPEDPGGRSNRGSGGTLRIGIKGPRLSIDVDASLLDLEFVGRQGGPDRRQLSGIGQVGWKLTEKLSTRFYGALQLQGSALDTNALFEGRRSGVSLGHQSGERTRISVFYEAGEDEFVEVSSNEITRVDEYSSYGLGVQLQLTTRLGLQLGFFDSRRDSSDPLFDRDSRAVTSRIRLGGNLLPW